MTTHFKTFAEEEDYLMKEIERLEALKLQEVSVSFVLQHDARWPTTIWWKADIDAN